MKPQLAFAMAPDKTRHVIDDGLVERLAGCCTILSPRPITDFGTPEARRILKDTEILVTGWGCPHIGPAEIAAAPRLRMIAHAAGTVKYTIDAAAYEAGITVSHAAEANAVPVAEYTLAAIIFANKRVFELRDLYRRDHKRASTWALMDEPIGNYRRTVGLIGASRIGRKVARLLRMLDVEVLLADPYVLSSDPVCRDARLVGLDTVMAEADVVSIHAPLLASTRHMIGARELKLMRDGAALINTARGALVDEAALVAELATGRIQAVIDVTDPEIPAEGSPLYDLPNVFLTPHVAGAAGTERARLGLMAVEEVERFVAGQKLHHAIAPELLERIA
jgi:phosphoglycerate dehydrogenase-like enzyme